MFLLLCFVWLVELIVVIIVNCLLGWVCVMLFRLCVLGGGDLGLLVLWVSVLCLWLVAVVRILRCGLIFGLGCLG